MSRILPVSPSLEHLKNEAKSLLRAQQKGDVAACPVLRRLRQFAQVPDAQILQGSVSLQEVQYALAMEYGFASWADMKRHVESLGPRPSLQRDTGKAWIDGLPEVGWGRGKDCTFAGALEAALLATEEPYSYSDLMGLSGLAFRFRFGACCGSSPIGEMPDEYEAICRTTGWHLPTDVQLGQEKWDHQAVAGRMVMSIDAGKPVLAYNDSLNVAVVYGYEGGGQILWYIDYRPGKTMPYKVSVDKIGPLQSYLARKVQALPPVEQLREALKLAVAHWHRGKHDGGVAGREYDYGAAAYDACIAWLEDVDGVATERRQAVINDENWLFMHLVDARRAAAQFLHDRAELLQGAAADTLRQTAEQCSALAGCLRHAQNEEGLFPYGKAAAEVWTPEFRRQEAQVLREARQQDAAIIRQLEHVLATMA